MEIEYDVYTGRGGENEFIFVFCFNEELYYLKMEMNIAKWFCETSEINLSL